MKKIGMLMVLCMLVFTSAAFAQKAPLTTAGYGPIPYQDHSPYAPHKDGYSPDRMGYQDESIRVRIEETVSLNTRVIVVYVDIADPSQLRTAQSKPYPSEKAVRPDVMAKVSNAVVAVNADWFMYHNSGIIYRNGKLLRNRPDEKFDALAIDENGDLHIIAPLTKEGFEAIKTPIISSFCFGPALVIDGEPVDNSRQRVTYRQRTAIAQMGPLSYAFIVCDGSEGPERPGLSLEEFTQVVAEYHPLQAYNLDGGGSCYLFFDKRKINSDQPKRVRAVGDILYFATAIPGEEEQK